MNIKNRKKVESLVYDTLMKLEPSGTNSEKYKKLFKEMSDKQFLVFWKKIKTDDTAHLYVESDLYAKNQITMQSIEDSAKFLNVPLEEHIYLRHRTSDPSKPIRTSTKVPVMYLHLKRMQQLLSKKNRMNVDIDSGSKRSAITGGLNQSERTGRFTDADTQILASVVSSSDNKFHLSKGSHIADEILHFRADNQELRMGMNQHISAMGEVGLVKVSSEIQARRNDMFGRVTTSQGMKSLSAYYLAAGMISNADGEYVSSQMASKKK